MYLTLVINIINVFNYLHSEEKIYLTTKET